VRLDLVRSQDFAQRPLSEGGEAFVSRPRSLFANVPRQKPRRPQFVRIAKVLGFPASEVDNEAPRLLGDHRLASRPGTVIERRHDPEPLSAAQTSFDRLMRHPDRASNRIKGRRLAIGQQHPRALDPACRRGARTRNPRQLGQILIRKRQLNHLSGSRHD
jgi:hypothetical protein